ncbi:cilium assembly protein DZIP1L [Strix aluco]|uniref:cilium assembly protein DZIP1L n=1 Tax=Strix aluco TaxID=111821 RepID=UPI003DA1DF01
MSFTPQCHPHWFSFAPHAVTLRTALGCLSLPTFITPLPSSSPLFSFSLCLWQQHFSAESLHQPVPGAAGMPGAFPGLTIPVDIPPFHFQSRRVSMDWRRFSAINVERVAQEVDVATLQEHITSITFCNLDGERCPHCGQPADPILLKVLRMAQLSIEYLLHCQERLGTSLATHTQRLQAAHAELAYTQQQAAEQEVQLRGVKEENRRWKKLIAMQQLLLQAGPNTYCKCHLCDKAFMNDSFLQAHVQRRHAEVTKVERQKTKQVEQMEHEVEELKAELRETQQQLEVEREAEKMRREKEMERARQREEDGRRDLERWKEEERMKLHEEIDGLRQLFLTAFKDLASRSSAVEGKLQELQAREVAESNLGTLQDDDTEEARWQAPSRAELQGKRERVSVQRAEWRQALKDPWRKNQAQKLQKENKTLHAAPSQDQWAFLDHVHQQMDVLSTHLGEQPKVLKSQEKKINLVSASKPEVTWEVTKAVADEESSDRKEATLSGKQRLLEALWRNPDLLKQFRPILEEVLEEKLESMGVKRVAKGISTRTYKSLQALVRLQQQQKAEKFPGLLHLRNELVQAVMGKVRQCKKPSSALPRQLSIIPAQSPKNPRSLWGSQPVTTPAAVEPEASVIPQPAPRSRSRSTHSPPRTRRGTLRTSKAISPHQGLVPRQNSEVMLRGKQPALSPVRLSPKQEPALSAVVLGDETDSDRSDLDSLEETAGSGTATSTMVRLLERRLDAMAQRQPGRVKLFPALSSASPQTRQPTKKIQFAGDNSDLETSSPQDLAEPPLMLRGPPRSPEPWGAGLRGDMCW